MPSSWNGTGTSYLALGEPDDEGWMPATVWLTFFFLPILPLRRVKVRLLREQYSSMGLSSNESQELQIAEILPFSLLEVIKTYFFGWIFVPVVVLWPIVLAVYLGISSPRDPDQPATRPEPPWWLIAISVASMVVVIWFTMNHRSRRLRASLQAATQRAPK